MSAVVTLDRVLALIDSAAAAMQKQPDDDIIGKSMKAGSEASLRPLRAAIIKLAEIEAPLHAQEVA